MVLHDFYTLNDLQSESGQAKAFITINKDHEIFKGHFPGNPITPGVCMMQIIREITEKVVNKKLFMTASSNVKFVAIINPEIHSDLVLDLDISEVDGQIKVKNTTKFDDTVALKLNSTFIPKD